MLLHFALLLCISFCVKSCYILRYRRYYILRYYYILWQKLLHFALLLHFVSAITFFGVTGRPKSALRRTAEAELQALNLTGGGQASRLAKDRQEWGRHVDVLCATRRLKD